MNTTLHITGKPDELAAALQAIAAAGVPVAVSTPTDAPAGTQEAKAGDQEQSALKVRILDANAPTDPAERAKYFARVRSARRRLRNRDASRFNRDATVTQTVTRHASTVTGGEGGGSGIGLSEMLPVEGKTQENSQKQDKPVPSNHEQLPLLSHVTHHASSHPNRDATVTQPLPAKTRRKPQTGLINAEPAFEEVRELYATEVGRSLAHAAAYRKAWLPRRLERQAEAIKAGIKVWAAHWKAHGYPKNLTNFLLDNQWLDTPTTKPTPAQRVAQRDPTQPAIKMTIQRD